MNNMTMTLASDEWTVASMAEMFADDGTDAGLAHFMAETVVAWLVLNTHKTMSGWSYNFGSYSGPYSADAATKVLAVHCEAVDYVVERLAELADEYAAEQA